MEYPLLTSLFYQDKEQYEQVYRRRFDGDGTFHFSISGMKETLFVVMTRRMTGMLERIYQLNATVSDLFLGLPPVVRQSYLRTCLRDEIILTNGIEGVHSTRKEVNEAIDSVESDKIVRFKGLANRYIRLLDDDLPPLEDSRNIRALYDQLVAPELEQSDLPDGKIFRKNAVSVRSATDKEKHRGVYPEEVIIEMMDSALQMLRDKDIPNLVRVAVFHYLFGYIHPFYDGNGRMSRFISSCLLRSVLHPLVCLQLSYFIKNDLHAYYKAFDICNDAKSRGDLTPFVQMFLYILVKGLERQVEKLMEPEEKLRYYNGVVQRYELSEMAANVLYMLMQSMAFQGNGLTIQQLQEALPASQGTVRKALQEVQDVGAPVFVERRGHAYVYAVDLEKLEEQEEQK